MTYDGHDRQVRWVFPSKTTPGVTDPSDYEQYGYDPNGNRTSLRKRDGAVLTYHYDALNRMTAKIVPGGAGNVAYTYDLRGLQTSANFSAIGGGVTNAYDGFGRLASTTTHIGGSVRTVSHLYDREGREVETTFPDGKKFWTARDGLGRMKLGYSGALGDTSVHMTIFYYDVASRLYYFGRRWGTATLWERDNICRRRSGSGLERRPLQATTFTPCSGLAPWHPGAFPPEGLSPMPEIAPRAGCAGSALDTGAREKRRRLQALRFVRDRTGIEAAKTPPMRPGRPLRPDPDRRPGQRPFFCRCLSRSRTMLPSPSGIRPRRRATS